MVERLADILLLLRQRFRCRSSQPPIGEHLPPPSLLVDFRPRRTIALEKELAEIDRRIDRAVAAIIDGRITEQEAAAHLPALRQRRPALAAELASIGNAGVIVLRPAVVETYLRDLESLERAINSDLAIGCRSSGQCHPHLDRNRHGAAGARRGGTGDYRAGRSRRGAWCR
jgi:hypothetical protein